MPPIVSFVDRVPSAHHSIPQRYRPVPLRHVSRMGDDFDIAHGIWAGVATARHYEALRGLVAPLVELTGLHPDREPLFKSQKERDAPPRRVLFVLPVLALGSLTVPF